MSTLKNKQLRINQVSPKASLRSCFYAHSQRMPLRTNQAKPGLGLYRGLPARPVRWRKSLGPAFAHKATIVLPDFSRSLRADDKAQNISKTKNTSLDKNKKSARAAEGTALGVKDCGGAVRYGIEEQAFAGQRPCAAKRPFHRLDLLVTFGSSQK
jgi:hypothetical protein